MPKTKITLPPDPEDMNDKRADWIARSLGTFIKNTGQTVKEDGYEEIVGDFLADLGHFCDRKGINLQERLDVASHHYGEETDREGTQFNTGDPVDRMYDDAGAADPRNDRPNSDTDPEDDEDENALCESQYFSWRCQLAHGHQGSHSHADQNLVTMTWEDGGAVTIASTPDIK
jgi:hypothetical protein